MQDYSWNGAFLSYDDSVRRLGENVKICGLRCHDPETKLLESLAVGTCVEINRAGSVERVIEQARRWRLRRDDFHTGLYGRQSGGPERAAAAPRHGGIHRVK